MGVAEILALVQYLVALGRTLQVENREATQAELEAAGIRRKAAIADLEQAIADAEAKD